MCIEIVLFFLSVNEILLCVSFRRLFFLFFILIYNLYVELFYKQQQKLRFVLDMTENSNGDELDFYDFLETVTDKFDSIAQQSRENEIHKYRFRNFVYSRRT